MSSTMWAVVDKHGYLKVHLKAEGVWSADDLRRATEFVERFPRRQCREIAVCVRLRDDGTAQAEFHWSQPEEPYSEPFNRVWLDQRISWDALERQVKENARRKAFAAGMRKILIVDVPPGEAPEKIRKQWVGCEIPFMGEVDLYDSKFVRGILTGERIENEGGYRVGIKEAIAALRTRSETLEAAEWWEAWTDSPFGRWADSLVFSRHVCQVIP